VKTKSISYNLLTFFLRAALVVGLFASGWLIYSKLPHENSASLKVHSGETMLQIVLRPSVSGGTDALDIPVEFYPFDIVAARHEYFTERRAGIGYYDFMNEQMKGRAKVATRLDKQGQGVVALSGGSWWLHAQLDGEENLEWRLHLDVAGPRQTIELTPQNIYTRTRSF